jgi:hypothetical protein
MQPEVHPKVAAMHRRMSLLRRRVMAGSVALFIALFGGLYVQMATGNDPAVNPTQQVASSSSSAASSTQQSQTTSAPVTTSQS